MKNITSLVRNNIANLAPYSSARDEFEGDGILLDANENPIETGLNRYPDPYQRALKVEIAKLKETDAINIFLGNGSDEAIDLLLRIFCEPGNDNIIISDPSYGMYQVSAGINNVSVKKVPLTPNFQFIGDDMLAAADDSSKIAFICSPNNPSGNALEKGEIIKVIKGFKGIVVIDEAYIDFCDAPSFIKQLNKYPNLVVMQTFSKAWGLAGLRLGMAFSNPDIIQLMNKVKPPYNVNILTQQEALKALSNKEKVVEEIKMIRKERDRVRAALCNHPLVQYIFPSDSNFLLIRFTDASGIFKKLTSEDIIVRDRSKVTHGKNCLRITIGTPEENEKLINALNAYQK